MTLDEAVAERKMVGEIPADETAADETAADESSTGEMEMNHSLSIHIRREHETVLPLTACMLLRFCSQTALM
ncbi:hypothetical protein, partial [Gilvimarinus sp. 1_MG-2023]|uniref:hypothetical protein n=1 Tax=Gilvimarinus sp. 1_MG-2023 TaxID=3062638 RepID=UPI0026E3C148